MANGESDFLIRIKTALEDAGIKATDQQVKDLTDSMDDFGKKGENAHEKIKEGAHKLNSLRGEFDEQKRLIETLESQYINNRFGR